MLDTLWQCISSAAVDSALTDFPAASLAAVCDCSCAKQSVHACMALTAGIKSMLAVVPAAF